MEVLYRNQHTIFGAQPAAMVFPSTNCPSLSSSPMFAAPSSHSQPHHPYTCYSFQASPSPPPHHPAPSRTPTPERCSRSISISSQESERGATLKSVLRGEVPEAYSHFLSSSSSPPSSASLDPQRHSPLGKRRCPFVEVEASCSPACLGRVMPTPATTTVLSPPPEDVQTEPMDLSFKRPPSAASSASSSSSSSPASFLHHTFPPSPAEDHHQGHNGEFSLLRNLLQVGKTPQPSSSSSSSSSSSPFHSASPTTATSSASERSCDSPCSSETGFPSRHLCGSTRVTLAKKNMYPVSARVSDWLVKAVQFAHSVQCFREELNLGDRFTLLLNSWSRLLLLFMAESNFQFVVTPLRTEPAEPEPSDAEGGVTVMPSPDEPTMKSVEAIQTFIRKCQHMGVEAEEYRYLRMLVLFNSGNTGVSEPAKVDSFNSQIQKSLQQHVQSTRPRDVMHYSRLLMCLPSLYGISANMVERLFCRHIEKNAPTSMSSLLQELIRNMDR